MNMLDMRTVMLSYLISSATCALVMFSLWRQNRRQPGITLWLADFGLQFAGLLLVVMRGAIPDFLSIVVANLFIVGGTLALLIGLERYTDSVSSQRYNYIYLAAFVGVQSYFAFVQPSLQARNINISLGLAVFCFQCAWLLQRRVDGKTRQDARLVAYTLASLTLLCGVRIPFELAIPTGNDFFQSGLYETLIILAYQMLYISLTFAIALMVNRRLQQNLKNELAERERVEQALRLSEEKFAKAFQTSPYAITITRAADGKVIDVNQAFAAMSGFSREEALTGTTISLNIWADRAVREQVVAALATGQPVVGWEASFRRKDGALFAGSLSSQVIQLVDTPAILSSIEDITSRKQAEEALRASEGRFRNLFEHSPIGLFHSLPEGRFLRVNPALVAMLGYASPEEMVTSVSNIGSQVFVDPEQRTRILAVILNQDIWFKDEVLLRRTDGSSIIADLAGRRVLNTDGRLAYLEGFVQDITERTQAAEQLNQAKEVAEAANRAKSEFLARMSHELRTPLNAVLGFSELMSQDVNLTPMQQANLAIINRSGEHLLGLIDDVLDIAKLEAGRTTLDASDFDLHDLLGDLDDLFQLRAHGRGLALHVEQDLTTARWVHADAGKLRQILINLLGNAIKFTPTGSVTLTVEPAGLDDAGEQHLRFIVQDTGPGIPPAELTAIFEPFVQVRGGRTQVEGAGLGLPISRALARAMGGDLTATSTGLPGEGSCFCLEIPVALVAEGLSGVAPPHRLQAMGLQPGQPAYRLLIAEDDAASRQLLADLLARLGFAVRTVENGVEALAVWAEWRPHLIWMDINMPVMNGLAAARQIKEAAAEQAPIIIAVSADVLAEQRTSVLAGGCDDFVGKPFHEAEIIDQLVRRLGVHFIYGETPVVGWAAPSTAPLLPFDLTRLRAAWVAHVCEAATAADAMRLLALAEEVDDTAPPVATGLRQWVAEFDYAAIIAAVTRLPPP